MKKRLKSICAGMLLLQASHSFADQKISVEEKAVYQDIGALLLGQSKDTQVTSTPGGVYIESLFCRKQTPALTALLKDRLAIQQDQALISLFQKMFCAPADADSQVNLSAFSNQIQDPLPFSLATYRGMQALGHWSLNDSIVLSTTPAKQVEVNMFGINPRLVSNSVLYWEVVSPIHVRVWYGMFKMAPSDAIIYEFEYADQHWTLTHLWSSSRL